MADHRPPPTHLDGYGSSPTHVVEQDVPRARLGEVNERIAQRSSQVSLPKRDQVTPEERLPSHGQAHHHSLCNGTKLRMEAAHGHKGKVFYGQEPPRGESPTNEREVNYQLVAVMLQK